MKQRVLALAIKRMVWAELALTAALVPPAFAQSQPAPGAASIADAVANGAPMTVAQADGAAGAVAATGASASGAAAEATPAAPGANGQGKVAQIKRFEVTGSLIRQADKVGFNQVQTVTSKDIENSGQTSVADYLRSTSANSASSWSEGSTNSFAPGGAGIALRGLSEKYTLVLIDGMRVSPYAFAVNGSDQFFDLNTLPLNIIDRIEIVKTGAVSQYGSDAIAGVVNIITKKNFQGLELGGSYGGATNGEGGQGTTKFSILGGFGDLNADRFNVTAALSYYKSNGISIADRDTTQNQNFSNFPGGLSNQSVSYWRNPATGAKVPLSPCPNGGQAVPGTSVAQVNGPGTVCANNTAYASSLSPWTERLSAKVHADFKINDAMQAFADLWESNNTTVTNNFVGRLGNSTQTYDPATGGLTPISNLVPGSNPYNPFGVPAKLVYAFPATQAVHTSSNFWRAATGVKGSFSTPRVGDWDWTASYTHSQNTVSNNYSNLINAAALENIVQNGVFNFADPSSTPNGLNGLYGSTSTQAITKLDAVDATLSTPNLFTLPTGNVGLGLGTQFTHQSQYIGTGADYANGTLIQPSLQSVNGERNVAAVYYQIDIPILKNLTFSQSGRYDHYSDFGGAFSPRFALRFQPIRELTMYGSYNRGFRAPTLIENTSSRTYGAQGAVDSNDPNNPNAYNLVEEVQTGNSKLQPERTKNYNIGFQLSPTRNTDFGFDWYKIHIDNVIGTEDIQTVIDQNDPSKVIRNPNGTIAYVLLPYMNLSSLDTDGFETTFRQSVSTKIGTFTLSGDWAYVWHFKMPVGGESTDFAGNNGSLNEPFGGSFPRWKGNTSLNWNYHNQWNATLTWMFTGPYSQAILSPGQYPNMQDSVASYSQFNLMVSYTGFKHWTIYAGIDNIFNRAPPFDPVYMNASYQTGYDTSLYTYVGRFAQVGATYKF
ncbi:MULTISPECIES: TonB-dependent receptor [Burkholderia cepacia complex]|uniref:TonB-dependent receptor n=1 Tax=Burkholderia orbicola (strain MC0-3) TaxID=406425 RepID=B1K1P4_BURO0|nr:MULTISPECIES: TonB-dependent receptor [Burkholderia cepacia complex]ACA90894.1 TonB-dependent receptor [Burkholderia orbicola MC0-3]MBR8318819.1 TonB-dependent receptor [Burkholderia cenocepacia]HEB3531551.1 TonB-dependent receptor [Burkholderia cenocepacia]